MAIIATVIIKISFGNIRNIKIATTVAVPNQILRPSDAPIPISTKIDSLNVSTALSAVIFEVVRQRNY